MTRLGSLMLLSLFATGACANSVAAPAPPAERLHYETCMMGGLPGDGPDVELHGRAQAAFDRAQADFEEERFDTAAPGFQDAALLLLQGGEFEAVATFERDRRIAYANMVISWLNADDVAAVRLALENLAGEDLDLAEDLRRVASELPDPPGCDLAPL